MSNSASPERSGLILPKSAGRRLAVAGLASALLNPAGVARAMAECIGPNVVCPAPDSVARFGYFHVHRVLVNEKGLQFGVADSAVRAFLLKETGNSTYPRLRLNDPILRADGLPKAFLDENTGNYLQVRDYLLFVSAPKGSDRLNGRLYLDPENGEDLYTVVRPSGEIRDRVLGRLRGAQGPNADCVLNCAVIAVWERQISASNPRTFIDSNGLPERDQTAIWLWPAGEKEPSVHNLNSFSRIPGSRIQDLVARGEAAPATAIGPVDGNSKLEFVK